MVNVHPALRISVHNEVSPRIVPKMAPRGSAASTTPSAGPASPAPATDAGANFWAIFTPHNTPPAPVTPAQTKPAPPTMQSMFGANPYVTNPGGSAANGATYGYNPMYFATRATADKLAQMYGGTVVEQNAITPYGPFQQNQMNEMIRFSNGNVVNAGVLASYYSHGYSQEQVNQVISAEINDIRT
jgi:hypothetical protein